MGSLKPGLSDRVRGPLSSWAGSQGSLGTDVFLCHLQCSEEGKDLLLAVWDQSPFLATYQAFSIQQINHLKPGPAGPLL